MKKIILIALLLMALVNYIAYAAEDWTQYESGTNNIRLDGYGGNEGYIAFGDGNGTVLGYLWWDVQYGLMFATKGGQSLSSGTKFNQQGIRVSTSFKP